MIRNYELSFADIYPTSAWGSITVCALVAECFILNRTTAPPVRQAAASRAGFSS